VKRLGESVESIDYGYSISIPANKNDEGIPIISTADITENGRILYNKVRKINPPKKITEKLLLKNGDVLFNWRNSPELVGKTAIFELKEYKNYIYASFILRIRCDEIRTHNVFLKYLLSYYRQIGVFFKLSRRAVNQSNYNKNEIYVLLIPLPPLPIQQKIAEILSAVDEKIEAEENKKKSLEDLFKTLLNNLMTGKIRVNNLEV
jgi:type I restriction enzyme S subunit